MADPRMRAAAKRRGIEITSISRPIKPSDFKDFDLILAMDQQNRGIVILDCFFHFVFDHLSLKLMFGLFPMLCVENILSAFNRWKFKEPLPEDAHKKVSYILWEVCEVWFGLLNL